MEQIEALQKAYETALGSFLVAFNDVEWALYETVREILVFRGLVKFAEVSAPRKVDDAIGQLKALKADLFPSTELDLTAATELARFRNRVAHGAYRDTVTAFYDTRDLKIGFIIDARNKKNAAAVTLELIEENTEKAKALLDRLIVVRVLLQDMAHDARD